MGQYYQPCIITIKDGKVVVVAWLSSFAYNNGSKLMAHSYLGNNFVGAFEWLISPEGPYHKSQVVWAGDYGRIEPGYETNLYGLCEDEKHAETSGDGRHYPLLVNHTKRCYVDKREVEGNIHPMPLLTMETKGGGGGDYKGSNEDFLGIWARDVISVENIAPEGFEKESFLFGRVV